jgi:hypothetical protein
MNALAACGQQDNEVLGLPLRPSPEVTRERM